MEDALDELKTRSEDGGAALVQQLPRAAGMREQRWAHLLCGDQPVQQAGSGDAAVDAEVEPISLGQAERLLQRLATLETQVSQLQGQVAHLQQELGLSQA